MRSPAASLRRACRSTAFTNFGAEFWDRFRPTAPLFDLFADIVVSGRERCAQAARRASTRWPKARFRAQAPHAHAVHRRSRPENIAAARARGWQGHVFTDDAGTLERELVRARPAVARPDLTGGGAANARANKQAPVRGSGVRGPGGVPRWSFRTERKSARCIACLQALKAGTQRFVGFGTSRRWAGSSLSLRAPRPCQRRRYITTASTRPTARDARNAFSSRPTSRMPSRLIEVKRGLVSGDHQIVLHRQDSRASRARSKLSLRHRRAHTHLRARRAVPCSRHSTTCAPGPVELGLR